MIKRFFILILLSLLGYSAYLATLDESDLPPLKDGDLIFQTSWTDQSIAIGLASGSLYIHSGILKQADSGWVVIHAAGTVEEWPLSKWVDSGILNRFAVYRYRDLTQEQAAAVLAAAQGYYGRRYDHFFSFDNDTVYCSELQYLAFKDAGLPLGDVQRIGSMYVNNSFVKKLIEQRWRNYPSCKGKELTFEQCYNIIMSQELISPSGVANDPRLELIFSNYP